MRQSRFTEAQIIGMIKEQEAGTQAADVCRKHGLSHGIFYKYTPLTPKPEGFGGILRGSYR